MLNSAGVEQWQRLLIDRLAAAGHAMGIGDAMGAQPDRLTGLLVALEPRRFGIGLARRAAPPPAAGMTDPELVVDLAGAGPVGLDTLTIGLGADAGLAALPALLVAGGQPHLVARLGGRAVGEAYPMIRDRLWLGRALEDVLARAVTLIEKCIGDFAAGRLRPLAVADDPPEPGGGFAFRYLGGLAGGLAVRAWHRATREPVYWQVAYRPAPPEGVAETAHLGGPAWQALPDDGRRFYADPFLFIHEGRKYLFIEEYPYASRRGEVAVAELGPDGRFGAPRVVLKEPFHISYPQVFVRDGEVWMIPETAGARQLILYRAERFPDRWVRDTVLVDEAELGDATLIEEGGLLWLIASSGDGAGAVADAMVVYSAATLRGPWTPHRDNPIRIDARRARPGGPPVSAGGTRLLPMQDGSNGYGAGLGLAPIRRLSPEAVEFGPPEPILSGPSGSAASLQPYGRAGGIEVIDRMARPPRRRR
jgi:hypothetical protein